MENLKRLGIECLTLDVDAHESIVKCFANIKEVVGNQVVAYLVNNAGVGIVYTSTSQKALAYSVTRSRMACHRDISL